MTVVSVLSACVKLSKRKLKKEKKKVRKEGEKDKITPRVDFCLQQTSWPWQKSGHFLFTLRSPDQNGLFCPPGNRF